MYIHKAIKHLEYDGIRMKSWPRYQYLTNLQDDRLDCILVADTRYFSFAPYLFTVEDLLADDWETY